MKLRNSTVLYIPDGTCINVRIAKSNQSEEQIAENVKQCVNHIINNIPGMRNITSLGIKTSYSVTLPFYNKLSSQRKKIEPEDQQQPEKNEKDEEQEEEVSV